MSLFEELRELADNQGDLKDQYRLLPDGSVLMLSLTDSGDIGFYLVAPRIPGAGPIIGRYFSKVRTDSSTYMNVDSLRGAVTFHGKIRDQIVEARVIRRLENDISNRQNH